jgi:lipopolysaccharide/colanic/teichoic acid biosynthesis glycosyltransferase
MSTTFESDNRISLDYSNSDETLVGDSSAGVTSSITRHSVHPSGPQRANGAVSASQQGNAGFAKADGLGAPHGSWAQGITSVPFHVRLFEIIVAGTILILTTPIMLLIGLIIWLDTGGPILFFQRRLAIGARTFRFIKFRTLYADAKQRFPELYAYQYTPQQLAELRFKVEDDPRVTPQGRWLRKSSLDELPNFWNVITGEMALVGPRPEIPEMLPYYTGDMLLKFTVRPGVTGVAQISGRGRLGFHETVALDVEYARNRSFAYDMKILLKTIWMII